MKAPEIKQKAINYRKEGYSYNIISEKLSLSKSTVSYWLKDIDYKPNEKVLIRIKENLKKFTLYNQQKGLQRLKEREEIKRKAAEKIKNVSKRELWFIGSALYLAEGNKKNKEIRITNSDPRVIKLVIRWFRNICKVKPENIKAVVHIYPNNNEKQSIKYWSNITGIPKKQFSKTQIDRRIKKSRLKFGMFPFGTIHLRVKRSGNLFCKVNGWIEGILNKVNAGVVQW